MKKTVSTAIFILMLTACGTTTQTATQNSFSEKEYETAVKSHNFATGLFHEVYKNEKNSENFCISPMSASWALAMAANGAGKATAKEIYATLGFTDMDADSINVYLQKCINRLSTLDPERVKVEVANSVWISDKIKIEKEFLKKNKGYYDAEVKNVAFDAATVKVINDWCSQKTAGKINEIVKELSPMTRMMLINALYFNGRWGKTFSKNRTTAETFTKENGEKITVQMMHQTFDTKYYEDETVQMVAKPFGRGVFSMYFILPRDGVGMDNAAAALSENFAQWCSNSEKYEVNLALPRFKADYGTSLKQTLQAMGMSNAFTPGMADFSEISTSEDIYIGNVMQKTFVKVDEEGAEAAAVTSVMLEATAAGPPVIKNMKIDRPFFYAIRENSSGNILFIGKNGHPKE